MAIERDRLIFDGEVIESNKGQFKVKVNGHEDYFVLCTLSGKIKQNSVKILLGDRVSIEVSEYDTSRGRIIFRNK